jgi:hypothetical protein
MPRMKTSMRSISKVKQFRLKPSRPLLPQSKCVVTNPRRLGEARSIARCTTTPSERLGDAFATYNFRYRSHSKFSSKVIHVQNSLVQRTSRLLALSREALVLSHWRIDQKTVSPERSFSKWSVGRRYICTPRKIEIHTDPDRPAKRSRSKSSKSLREIVSKMTRATTT